MDDLSRNGELRPAEPVCQIESGRNEEVVEEGSWLLLLPGRRKRIPQEYNEIAEVCDIVSGYHQPVNNCGARIHCALNQSAGVTVDEASPSAKPREFASVVPRNRLRPVLVS